MRRSDRNPMSTHNGYKKLRNGLFNQELFEIPDSEFTFLDSENIADYEFQEDAGMYRQMQGRQEPFRPLTANLIEEFLTDVFENRVERQPVLYTGARGREEFNRVLQDYIVSYESRPRFDIDSPTIFFGTPGEIPQEIEEETRETVSTENMSTAQLIEYFDRISQDE